jgi:aconitate hydratase
VLPLQFKDGDTFDTYSINGTETFDLVGLSGASIRPRQEITLQVTRADGETLSIPLILRIDTPIEVEYYKNGGILQYVLRQLLA